MPHCPRSAMKMASANARDHGSRAIAGFGAVAAGTAALIAFMLFRDRPVELAVLVFTSIVNGMSVMGMVCTSMILRYIAIVDAMFAANDSLAETNEGLRRLLDGKDNMLAAETFPFREM